jgi:MOSC domain-containing protein YiiM
LSALGLDGDEHEYEGHGGPDKAVLLYGNDNYAHWREELRRNDMGAGGFGENFTVSDLLESNVCIGDVYRIGEALIQVSQPRIPCYKLSRRWNLPTMTKLTERTGRTGWYARVLHEGMVEPGPMTLEDRPHPAWTVDAIREIRAHRRTRPDDATALAACPELASSWKRYLLGED